MHYQDRQLLIKAEDVTVRYGAKTALEDISFEIFKGDLVAITGPNGGGKSSLIKSILKLVTPCLGRIAYYDGEKEVNSLSFGYLPQKNNIDSRFPITVREVVASGLYENKANLIGKLSKANLERLDYIMNLMGVKEFQGSVIGSLSGGQLQRALLGRALISNPEVIVLDEPLSYVDVKFVSQIYEIIEKLSEKATVIVVSHEMTILSKLANRHWIIDRKIEECHAAKHYVKIDCE